MRYVLAALVLGIAVAAIAQPWRYVDEKGQVHITNDVMQLPKKQRERVLKKMGLTADAGMSLPVGVGRRPDLAPTDAGVAPPVPPLLRRSPSTGGDEAAPAPTSAAPPRRTGNDEADRARWQALQREARERIADAEHRLENARLVEQQARQQALVVPSGQAYAAQAQAKAGLAEAESDLAAARAELGALEARARTEGVPPGWLR